MSQELYCHSLPARILHWVNAAVIGLLTASGLYIRDPGYFPVFVRMDIARKAHFIAMYLIVYGIIIRLYYSYVSKDYRELLFKFRDFRGFPALMKYYLFMNKSVPNFGKYNPGQKLLYNMWVNLLLVQSVTGFILYWPDLFAPAAGLLGGHLMVRQAHFLITWFFIVTVALHVYLAFIGGWDVVKSMITGYYPEGKPMQPVSEAAHKERSLTV